VDVVLLFGMAGVSTFTLPALSVARRRMYASICLTNQRNMGLATTMYTNTHRGSLPTYSRAMLVTAKEDLDAKALAKVEQDHNYVKILAAEALMPLPAEKPRPEAIEQTLCPYYWKYREFPAEMVNRQGRAKDGWWEYFIDAIDMARAPRGRDIPEKQFRAPWMRVLNNMTSITQPEEMLLTSARNASTPFEQGSLVLGSGKFGDKPEAVFHVDYEPRDKKPKWTENVPAHGGRHHVAFFDGHAAAVNYAEILDKQWQVTWLKED
jgi:prepilin-type processing-associated H-X9-DG protein